jgi:diguanylate cyclase (GGDEF)-like protein
VKGAAAGVRGDVNAGRPPVEEPPRSADEDRHQHADHYRVGVTAASAGRRIPGSVIYYLLCLALVPVLGVASFAAALVREAYQQEKATLGVERAMQRVQSLSSLRASVTQEFFSVFLGPNAAMLGMTVDEINRTVQASGSGVIRPVPDAQAITDDLLNRLREELREDQFVTEALASLTKKLAVLRATAAEAQLVKEEDRVHQAAPIVQGYSEITTEITDLQTRTNYQIATGAYGPVSPTLLRAAFQLDAVTRLVTEGEKQATALFSLSSAAGAQRAQMIATLMQSYHVYLALASDLGPSLDETVGREWASFSASQKALDFDRIIKSVADNPPPLRTDRTGLRLLFSLGVPVDRAQQALFSILITAVHQGVLAARQNRQQATSHAHTVTLIAVGTVVLTAAMLFAIGGTVRRRLRRLADSSRRLSSGHLQTITINGPRELEHVSQGLNDAIITLQKVVTVAEKLAAGDLHAAELDAPVPGRLGQAVHASVEQVARVLRERDTLQQELAFRASHDTLTGLPNRAAAESRLLSALEEARAAGTHVALLFVDLDFFKAVNDTYGHAAGDHVLQVTAGRMSAQVRGTDTLCRLGGDEFVIIMTCPATPDEITAIGQRIVSSVNEPIPFHEHTLRVSASIGVGISHDGSADIDALLQQADHAVYRAKANGRNTLTF